MIKDNQSFNRSVCILNYYCNSWAQPLTPAELFGLFGEVNKEHLETINKYLVLCKDGIIRIRSRKLIVDWQERYNAQIKANWEALGVKS